MTKHKSALKEQEATEQPEPTSTSSIEKIRAKRAIKRTTKALLESLLQGNITALSQAITLVESTNPKHLEQANSIINDSLPHANKSVRIGITGVPGVGKSTFIEAFGTHLTELGHKVAVLAVDPSSSITKGSILGDKTRMEDLVKNKMAFIRPSASGESLGGVARKTRESIILCEAAGYDVIIIETVGVGQSETAVHSMVDFFLLLKLAGAGDELQGIKRGIMEMADAIAINKADGDNIKRAKLAKVEFNRALHLYPLKPNAWQPKVHLCSAIKNEGVDDIWKDISKFIETTKANNGFTNNRKTQNKYWFLQTINDSLKEAFYANKATKIELERIIKDIENSKVSPFVAAKTLLDLYYSNK